MVAPGEDFTDASAISGTGPHPPAGIVARAICPAAFAAATCGMASCGHLKLHHRVPAAVRCRGGADRQHHRLPDRQRGAWAARPGGRAGGRGRRGGEHVDVLPGGQVRRVLAGLQRDAQPHLALDRGRRPDVAAGQQAARGHADRRRAAGDLGLAGRGDQRHRPGRADPHRLQVGGRDHLPGGHRLGQGQDRLPVPGLQPSLGEDQRAHHDQHHASGGERHAAPARPARHLVRGPGAGRAAGTGKGRHRHPPLLVSRACDSATRNSAAATVCSGASTPPAPPSPFQVMSQVIVTVTGYAPPGCPALDWS